MTSKSESSLIETLASVKLSQSKNMDPYLKRQNHKIQPEEKTPMTLINELAKYNKVKAEYILLDEVGPAHKRIFRVCLHLGDTEKFEGSDLSIKKAQHAAARLALEGTTLPAKPPAKKLPKPVTSKEEDNDTAQKTSTGASEESHKVSNENTSTLHDNVIMTSLTTDNTNGASEILHDKTTVTNSETLNDHIVESPDGVTNISLAAKDVNGIVEETDSGSSTVLSGKAKSLWEPQDPNVRKIISYYKKSNITKKQPSRPDNSSLEPPTVELNALATKRGEKVIYQRLPSQSMDAHFDHSSDVSLDWQLPQGNPSPLYHIPISNPSYSPPSQILCHPKYPPDNGLPAEIPPSYPLTLGCDGCLYGPPIPSPPVASYSNGTLIEPPTVYYTHPFPTPQTFSMDQTQGYTMSPIYPVEQPQTYPADQSQSYPIPQSYPPSQIQAHHLSTSTSAGYVTSSYIPQPFYAPPPVPHLSSGTTYYVTPQPPPFIPPPPPALPMVSCPPPNPIPKPSRRYAKKFQVRVWVGERYFDGEGDTKQLARHNAAVNALKVLRTLSPPNNRRESSHMLRFHSSESPNNSDGEDDKSGEKSSIGSDGEDVKICHNLPKIDEKQIKEPPKGKNEIGMIYEVATKLNLPVTFKTVLFRNSSNYIIECQVGPWTTDGEGQNKKTAKQNSASEMIDLLASKMGWDELLRLTTTNNPERRNKLPENKKKIRINIKKQKASPDYGQLVNPVTRLIQVQQAMGSQEAIYTLIGDKISNKKKEFIYECRYGDFVSQGHAHNKKLAKRNAAEQMLEKMGYTKNFKTPGKPLLKTKNSKGDHLTVQPSGDESDPENESKEVQESRKSVKFNMACNERPISNDFHFFTDMLSSSASHQDRPSLLKGMALHSQPTHNDDVPLTPELIAHEMLRYGRSPSLLHKSRLQHDASLPPPPINDVTFQERPRYADLLKDLCQAFNFSCEYTHFPSQQSGGSHFTLITVGLSNPLVVSGSGPTQKEANECAAEDLLKTLAQSAHEEEEEPEVNHTSSSNLSHPQPISLSNNLIGQQHWSSSNPQSESRPDKTVEIDAYSID